MWARILDVCTNAFDDAPAAPSREDGQAAGSVGTISVDGLLEAELSQPSSEGPRGVERQPHFRFAKSERHGKARRSSVVSTISEQAARQRTAIEVACAIDDSKYVIKSCAVWLPVLTPTMPATNALWPNNASSILGWPY